MRAFLDSLNGVAPMHFRCSELADGERLEYRVSKQQCYWPRLNALVQQQQIRAGEQKILGRFSVTNCSVRVGRNGNGTYWDATGVLDPSTSTTSHCLMHQERRVC